MGWDCGGATVGLKDANGNFITVYCGSCSSNEWCQPNNASFTGVGKCGGTNPLVYPYQRQLIDMLEAMGENDTTTSRASTATARTSTTVAGTR